MAINSKEAKEPNENEITIEAKGDKKLFCPKHHHYLATVSTDTAGTVELNCPRCREVIVFRIVRIAH
jgi:phage FluMu protein Com